ncbi:MAG: hypothetical protein M5F18_11720 [Asgard group archaeon]|nr:hypothetical protein [Asgard group archaeon]
MSSFGLTKQKSIGKTTQLEKEKENQKSGKENRWKKKRKAQDASYCFSSHLSHTNSYALVFGIITVDYITIGTEKAMPYPIQFFVFLFCSL